MSPGLFCAHVDDTLAHGCSSATTSTRWKQHTKRLLSAASRLVSPTRLAPGGIPIDSVERLEVHVPSGHTLGLAFSGTTAKHLEIVQMRADGAASRYPGLRAGMVVVKVEGLCASKLSFTDAMELMRKRPLCVSVADSHDEGAATYADLETTPGNASPALRRQRENLQHRDPWSKQSDCLPPSLTLEEANELWNESFDKEEYEEHTPKSTSCAAIVLSSDSDSDLEDTST